MTMHDRVLQDAYRSWMETSGSSTHLDEPAWVQLAAGELAEPDRAKALSHVMACAECSEVWKALLALNRDARSEGLIPLAGTTSRSSWRSRIIPLALAATLLAAVSGVLLMRPPSTPVADAVRGATAIATVEGLMVAYSADGVPQFVWTPVPEANQYLVELFSEDGRPHWAAEVTAPPMAWPADSTRSKGTYRWRVDARRGDVTVARSRLMLLELSR